MTIQFNHFFLLNNLEYGLSYHNHCLIFMTINLNDWTLSEIFLSLQCFKWHILKIYIEKNSKNTHVREVTHTHTLIKSHIQFVFVFLKFAIVTKRGTYKANFVSSIWIVNFLQTEGNRMRLMNVLLVLFFVCFILFRVKRKREKRFLKIALACDFKLRGCK